MKKANLISILIIALGLTAIWGCDEKQDEPPLPEIFTYEVTEITDSTAVCGGNITNDGGEFVSFRGVCWGKTTTPTIEDDKTIDGTGAGNFSSQLTNLESKTLYYARAYATTKNGTAYGSLMSFTTGSQAPVGPDTSTIKDIEGNKYLTVKIGNQWWMAANLRTTKFNDGTTILNIPTASGWKNTTNPAYCWYENNGSNSSIHGALYNGYVTISSKNVCPAGWHVPSTNEFVELINYLGGASLAGGKLKQAGTEFWMPPNTGATNETWFTAVPSGFRLLHNDVMIFAELGIQALFRTDDIDVFGLNYNDAALQGYYTYLNYGHTIRCIKDE
jgi:uncharacterized protein (TIGR02145 family)